jgi:hypothetical protein
VAARVLAGAALVAALLANGSEPRADTAQPAPPLEYQVKAAFLYQLLNFVEWPPAPSATANADGIVIGVLGDTPLTAALQPVVGRSVKGHPLMVRPIREARAMGAVQVLFVAASERERLAGILQAVRGASILTVGEVDGFTRLGGVINFVIVDGKVAFEINVRAAEGARLRISSKLLRLARVVGEKG